MIRHLVTALAIGLAIPSSGFSQAAESSPAPSAAESPVPAQPAGPRIVYNNVPNDGNYIAITFDDGPNPVQTPRLLDILAKRNIKATFFVVGQCVKEYPEVLKRIVREGHEIGNHSWSHPNLGKMSDAAVKAQLQDTHDLVLKTAGVPPKSFRPPYGSFSARQQQWAYKEFGYKTILWGVDPFDWKKPGASVIAQRIVSQTKSGDIILAHDIHKQTIDAMEETLDGLIARGFRFATVSELMAMEKPQPPKPAVSAASPARPAAPAKASPGAKVSSRAKK